MIAEKMKPYVKNNSAIRMMFEEGNRLRAIYGPENVFDFSLGNPSVPAPDCVRQAIIDLVNEEEPTSYKQLKLQFSFPESCSFFSAKIIAVQCLNREECSCFAPSQLHPSQSRKNHALHGFAPRFRER